VDGNGRTLFEALVEVITLEQPRDRRLGQQAEQPRILGGEWPAGRVAAANSSESAEKATIAASGAAGPRAPAAA